MVKIFTQTDPGIESQLIDLTTVSLTQLRTLNNAALRHSLRHVVERTRSVRIVRRSANAGGGERID